MIDAFLINAMPWSIGFKTIMFAALWVTLFLQTSSTKLGVWLNIFFFLTSLTSFVVANYVWYVNNLREPEELYSVREWALAIFMNLLPFMTSLSGLMVTRIAHRAEAILQKEAHDHAQHTL